MRGDASFTGCRLYRRMDAFREDETFPLAGFEAQVRRRQLCGRIGSRLEWNLPHRASDDFTIFVPITGARTHKGLVEVFKMISSYVKTLVILASLVSGCLSSKRCPEGCSEYCISCISCEKAVRAYLTDGDVMRMLDPSFGRIDEYPEGPEPSDDWKSVIDWGLCKECLRDKFIRMCQRRARIDAERDLPLDELRRLCIEAGLHPDF